MKATIIACADRAVGAFAAAIGLVFLAMTVRALAPIAPIDRPERVASIVASESSAARHVTIRSIARRTPSSASRQGRVAATHASSHTVARALATAPGFARPAVAARRSRSPQTMASPVRRSSVATAIAPHRSSLPVARTREKPSFMSPKAEPITSTHLVTIAPPRARRVDAIAPYSANSPVARVDGRAMKRVALRPRPLVVRPFRRARPASTSLRLPARFDVRPPLVVVSDASEAALPATDALPTIATRKRRH